MGPLSYKVKLENGEVVRHHVDSVRRREESSTTVDQEPLLHCPDTTSDNASETVEAPETQEEQTPVADSPPDLSSSTASPQVCRSNRDCNSPNRFEQVLWSELNCIVLSLEGGSARTVM